MLSASGINKEPVFSMITPQILAPKLAQAINLNNDLYLKREDQHPYGSHKGRSIPWMIENYAKQGIKKFVISSSGNAALSAVLAVQQYNQDNPTGTLMLTVYVGKSIPVFKLKKISRISDKVKEISIKQVANPRQSAFLADKSGEAKNLRQSTDDNALDGYDELAGELSEIPNLSAIFVPTSSGTTVVGLFNGFTKRGISPEIHIVQTTSCHPFVDDASTDNEETSFASAIADRIGHRTARVKQIMGESGGDGWIASNHDINLAIQEVKQKENLEISPNSALSIVGLKKAAESGRVFKGSVVCLITGD